MALVGRSLFLYGYQVTELNQSLDFQISGGGPELNATLRLGFYSLTSLLEEVLRALTAEDAVNNYTVTADRSVLSGTENRITISTDGVYLDLLFSSGTRAASSCASLLGFNSSDYTGAITYTGSSSTGTALIPDTSLTKGSSGYNYLSTDKYRKIFGSVNVGASGLKEAVVFNIQRFWEVEFKYQPESFVGTDWVPFLNWAIQQRRLEFVPNISDYNTFFEGTLESTDSDGKGLGFKLIEMLPQFPDVYRTGKLTFRETTTS